MKKINFETKTEAIKVWNELYKTGFYDSDLTIQYNGNIRKYQLVIQDEDNNYRQIYIPDLNLINKN